MVEGKMSITKFSASFFNTYRRTRSTCWSKTSYRLIGMTFTSFTFGLIPSFTNLYIYLYNWKIEIIKSFHHLQWHNKLDWLVLTGKRLKNKTSWIRQHVFAAKIQKYLKNIESGNLHAQDEPCLMKSQLTSLGVLILKTRKG